MTSQDNIISALVYQHLLKLDKAIAHGYKYKAKPVSWFLISY